MFCVKCGKELPYDAAYCSFCGTKVINEVNTGISSNTLLFLQSVLIAVAC